MSNEEILQKQIHMKTNMDMPYFCPNTIYRQIKTDINEFPYRRFFRGKVNVSYPSIYGRDAGYSPIENSPAFVSRPPPETNLTNLCFQLPCSTVLPCNNQDCVFISP